MKKKGVKKFLFGWFALIIIYVGYMLVPLPIPEEIVHLPNDSLRERSEEVVVFDDEVEWISEQLHEVLGEVDRWGNIWGLGMSAPQIGYNKRIIAVKESYGDYKTMVNPEIIEKKWLIPYLEGCFSVEGRHLTKRYFSTVVRYRDVEGDFHEESASIIVQQEIDHLNGLLISD